MSTANINNLEAANLLSRLDRIPITRTSIGIAFLLTLVWLCEAFDVGIVGGVILMVKDMWELTPSDTGLLGVCSTMGIVIGSLFAGRMMDLYGRKKVVIVGVILFSILTAACGAVADIRWIIGARFLAGLGLGAVFPIPALMMAEFVGGKWRATLISVTGGILITAYSLPNLLSAWIVQTFPPEIAWRLPFLLGGVPLVLVIALIIWLPETPRWLIQRGRTEEVRKLVEKLENEAKIPHDAGYVNPGIVTSLQGRGKDEAKGSIKMLFKKPYVGRFIIACLIGMGNVVSVYALMVYAPMILSSRVASTAIALKFAAFFTISGFLGALVGGRLADTLGRRPVFICYSLISALGFVIAAQSATLFTLLLGIYVGAFSGIGVSPLGRTYIAEQFPTHLRGTAAATGEALLRIVGGVIIAFFIPFVFDAGGVKAVFWMVTAFFIMFVTPFIIWGRETAGMSVEEACRIEAACDSKERSRQPADAISFSGKVHVRPVQKADPALTSEAETKAA